MKSFFQAIVSFLRNPPEPEKDRVQAVTGVIVGLVHPTVKGANAITLAKVTHHTIFPNGVLSIYYGDRVVGTFASGQWTYIAPHGEKD